MVRAYNLGVTKIKGVVINEKFTKQKFFNFIRLFTTRGRILINTLRGINVLNNITEKPMLKNKNIALLFKKILQERDVHLKLQRMIRLPVPGPTGSQMGKRDATDCTCAWWNV
ncbi:hypothetical protein ACVNPZ_11405 [Staphylococcus aureus]